MSYVLLLCASPRLYLLWYFLSPDLSHPLLLRDVSYVRSPHRVAFGSSTAAFGHLTSSSGQCGPRRRTDVRSGRAGYITDASSGTGPINGIIAFPRVSRRRHARAVGDFLATSTAVDVRARRVRRKPGTCASAVANLPGELREGLARLERGIPRVSATRCGSSRLASDARTTVWVSRVAPSTLECRLSQCRRLSSWDPTASCS